MDGEADGTTKEAGRELWITFECNVEGAFEIWELMVNHGDMALPYGQNMNEVVTDTVNISKGISVASNTANTIAKIDADGFRVLNKGNEADVILQATAEKVVAKKLKSMEETELGKLLIQDIKIGNEVQTWITGV
jgi:hypothetical protein